LEKPSWLSANRTVRAPSSLQGQSITTGQQSESPEAAGQLTQADDQGSSVQEDASARVLMD
jgi:hypothetical protein